MNSVELGVSERSQKHLRALKNTLLISWSFLIFSKISKGQTIPLGPRFKSPFQRSPFNFAKPIFSFKNPFFISLVLELTYMEENRYFLVYLIFTPFFLSWSWISSLFGGVKLRFRIGSYLLNSHFTLTPPPFFIKSP